MYTRSTDLDGRLDRIERRAFAHTAMHLVSFVLIFALASSSPSEAADETPSPMPTMASPVAVTESNPVTPVETTVEEGPALDDYLVDDLRAEVARERARADRLAIRVLLLRVKVERLRAAK